jgi:hypothetical protein
MLGDRKPEKTTMVQIIGNFAGVSVICVSKFDGKSLNLIERRQLQW